MEVSTAYNMKVSLCASMEEAQNVYLPWRKCYQLPGRKYIQLSSWKKLIHTSMKAVNISLSIMRGRSPMS